METRTCQAANHLLQTPDSFVRAVLPGMKRATAIVHAGPALGARFTEYTAELEQDGVLGQPAGERFLFVLTGELILDGTEMQSGEFAFIPQGESHEVIARSESRVAVIEKQYRTLSGSICPQRITGDSKTLPSQSLLGDEDIQVTVLIPENFPYDLAVNRMTFKPGAVLPLVECHVMEHGLLMLAGEGVYRLGDHWHPVKSGDFIWMAPFCPQWFVASGKQPAEYLLYKDWNRHPL
jgi:(S)-ureidoglycine aminohydrolase